MTKPAFRKPWEHGARAYIEADTFAALGEGMKRMRKTQIVLMPNTGEAGTHPCMSCGIALGAPYEARAGQTDPWSYWTWNPKTKTAYGMHYYCSWMNLMQEILDLGRILQF